MTRWIVHARIGHPARRHGLTDDDILHAVRNALRKIDLDEGLTMLIGPASDATLLEIAVLGLAGDDPFVIHATPLRPRFPAASGQAVTRHTDETIERAAEWFAELSDLLDPETIVAERLDDLQSIVVAVDAVRIDEARLRDAVMAARRNGRSLHQIAASLGVSRQAARQRFGNFRPALTPARSREPMTTPVSQSHR